MLESAMGEGSNEVIHALSLYVIAHELSTVRLQLESLANCVGGIDSVDTFSVQQNWKQAPE
jgi:hypothetical protein